MPISTFLKCAVLETALFRERKILLCLSKIVFINPCLESEPAMFDSRRNPSTKVFSMKCLNRHVFPESSVSQLWSQVSLLPIQFKAREGDLVQKYLLLPVENLFTSR